jgi:hypothetical protein
MPSTIVFMSLFLARFDDGLYLRLWLKTLAAQDVVRLDTM